MIEIFRGKVNRKEKKLQKVKWVKPTGNTSVGIEKTSNHISKFGSWIQLLLYILNVCEKKPE